MTPLALHTLLVLVTAIALFIALGSWGATVTSVERCLDSEAREHVRTILLAGLDESLKQHIMQTFDTWMKDPSEQPKRAISGMQIAISAHVRSRAAAKSWSPPQC